MKILFTVENYYPKMSGVPVVTRYLAEGLQRLNHEVCIATRWIEGRDEKEEYNGITIYRFHINYNLIKKTSGDLLEYKNFCINSGFNAIVCECSQCVTTDALLPYLKDYKGKKVFHSHGFSGMLLKPFEIKDTIRNTVANTLNYFNWRRYYNNYFKNYINQFDKVFCLSEVDSSKDYLETYAPGKVSVLSNAADDMFFEYDELSSNPLNKYAPKFNGNYYISIANYNEYKNQIGILEEFYKLEENNNSMVFVGSTPTSYYNELLREKHELDKKYGKRNVYCLTGVNRMDIPGIIGNATLYLVGSRFEEFSISLIESMALGVPFVSTNVGNARVLPGGITINEISYMHKAIADLMAKPDRRVELSNCGRVYTREKCRISEAVKTLENVLEK